MNNTDLIAFNTISTFVSELGKEFSSKHKPLKLYWRLIRKTTLSHEKVISKHLQVFSSFCIKNREAIREKNSNKLVEKKITYSDRVFINMGNIFNMADKDTSEVIWKHLLCISALVDPAGKAKEILQKNMEDGKTGKDETELLTSIISKVESIQSIDKSGDPMAAVSSIMSSGVFTEILGGMQSGLASGKLDIGKLVGAVQGMVSSLGSSMGDDPEAGNAFAMISSITSMLGGSQGSQGLGFGMALPQLNTTPNPNPKIEEFSEEKK